MNSPSVTTDHWKPAWSTQFHSEIRSLSLARETHQVLVADAAGWVYLLNAAGQIQTQKHFPRLTSSALSWNGTSCAVADNTGQVMWLSPDLSVRWQHALKHPVLHLAVDPHGQFLAATDSKAGIYIWANDSHLRTQFTVARPLVHLSFLQEVPLLVGSAEFGLVLAFDMDGHIQWRDHPLIKMNSLSADASGQNLLLACYSEGVHVYRAATGEKQPRLATSEPCLFVEQTVSGQRIITANVKNALHERTADGTLVGQFVCEKAIRMLALSALGDYVLVALKGGQVQKLACQNSNKA